MNGFNGKLAKELDNLVGQKQTVTVKVFNDQTQNFAWMGAAVISSQNTFQKLWIDRQEYQENGDRIFLEKAI